MPRISSNSFAVNSSLEQQIELAAVKSGVSVPISTSSELDMNLTQVGGDTISLDQALSAKSLPVVIASDQTAIEVKTGMVDLGVDLTQVGGQSIALGETDMTSCIPVVIADDQTSVSVTPAVANNTTLASAQEVAAFGHDGANYRRLNCSTGGNLKVETELENHSGSEGNLDNGSSVLAGDVSLSIDTSNKTLLTVFGNTTDTNNGIIPQISANGSAYYAAGYEIWPDSNGDFYQNFPNISVNNFRLKYQGTATVVATLLSNNH